MSGFGACDLQYPEGLVGGVAGHGETSFRELFAQFGGQPALQGIRAEVFLHHQVGVSLLGQSRQPHQQDRVQLRLAHPDGRIGPNGVEPQVGVDALGRGGVDIVQSQRLRVVVGQLNGALVDVHGVDGGRGGAQGQGQGDGPPSAANVEQMAFGGRRRRLVEQDRGALVASSVLTVVN